MLWLFAQCLYYGAGTGSYTMFLVQCLYYEADTDSYIIFVGSIPVYFRPQGISLAMRSQITSSLCMSLRVNMVTKIECVAYRLRINQISIKRR
jgi:hypothetical protein